MNLVHESGRHRTCRAAAIELRSGRRDARLCLALAAAFGCSLGCRGTAKPGGPPASQAAAGIGGVAGLFGVGGPSGAGGPSGFASGASAAGASGNSGIGGSAGVSVRDAAMPTPRDADTDLDAESDAPQLDAGASDAGTDSPPAPFETNGQPLDGSNGAWTYSEFPDAQCRDGSLTGVLVNRGSTNKLLIFLEGGGRCADATSCALSPANLEAGSVIRAVASSGVLDRSQPNNPVRDWNFVYVPYCTGDRHGGANPDGNVSGVGPQKFVGYLNMEKFLNRIVPTFRDTSDVLLTGISAGGFGVAYNSVLVQRAFPNLKVKTVIDSAPFASKAVFSECDQRNTRALYKAETTFLGDCGAACPNPSDYYVDYGLFLAKFLRDRPSGLIESTEDAVERALFGLGNADCTGALDFLDPGVPAAAFRQDLLAYRKQLEPFPNFSTFYPDADAHTFLAGDAFYSVSAGGVRLVDWFTSIVNGQSPGHAGP